MRVLWFTPRHGEYGWKPNGKYFTKLTTNGVWRGFAVRFGKYWHGPLLYERVQRSTALNTSQD